MTDLPYFASKVQLGKDGVTEVGGLGSLSDIEKTGLEVSARVWSCVVAMESTCCCICLHSMTAVRFDPWCLSVNPANTMSRWTRRPRRVRNPQPQLYMPCSW